jgi:hypothetical protein
MTEANKVLSVERVMAHAAWDGECLLWKGAMANGTCPVCRVGGKTVVVRRAMWVALGKTLASKAAVLAKCGEDGCVAPEHLFLSKRGPKLGSKRTAATRARMATARRAASRLTEADVQAIRVARAPLKELVAAYGMCKRTIQDIRSGASWAPMTGPFSGLGKR